jgi:hypothetical protein
MTHLYRYEVLQRFAHLQSFNVEMPGMQEIIDPLTAVMVRLVDHKESEA